MDSISYRTASRRWIHRASAIALLAILSVLAFSRCVPRGPADPFSVHGEVVGVLSPGKRLAVNLTFENRKSYSIKIASLQVFINDSTRPNLVASKRCVGSTNLVVVQSLRARPVIRAHTTVSLEQLGIPRHDWPFVMMPNSPVSQDECKETTFFLRYEGTAKRQ